MKISLYFISRLIYEDDLQKIEKIKKVRKTKKYNLEKIESCKLGINYEKIGQVAGGMR